MPHHTLVLFSLVPVNQRAEQVVNHPLNSHLLSTLDNGLKCIDIGHVLSKSGHATLATLGRGETDVYVEGASISKIQCSFDIEPSRQVVMLYDRSHGGTTQVSGDDAMPFEHGRPRKVAVNEKLNTRIGMGGEKRDLVVFDIKWHADVVMGDVAQIQHRRTAGFRENPRLARTVDEADTRLPSQRQTRVHTPGQGQLRVRYKAFEELGKGHFGKVYRALDVDAGRILAVKIIDALKGAAGARKQLGELKREVEILAGISHPHIVDYVASQGWGGPQVEIFMGLKQGTLESLMNRGPTPHNLGDLVLKHMLQALDFLAMQDIIHRDVKPENILYVAAEENQCRFQLGDFGLSNRASIAATFAGSPLYMAPEMFEPKQRQTHKVDVWSLYVTILWTLDVNGFRHASEDFGSIQTARNAILEASKSKNIQQIREMTTINPNWRASAAQMLVKIYNGEGLTTPRNRVPRLEPVPSIREPGVGPQAASAPSAPSASVVAARTRPAGRKVMRHRGPKLPQAPAERRPLRIGKSRHVSTAVTWFRPTYGHTEDRMTEAARAEAKMATVNQLPSSLCPGSFPDNE